MEKVGDPGITAQTTRFIFYSWKFYTYNTENSTILNNARSFHQYKGDRLAKMEADRLIHLRGIQTILWTLGYSRFHEQLEDSERVQDDADMVCSGCIFILASSYIVIDRCMRQPMHKIISISTTNAYLENITYNDLPLSGARDCSKTSDRKIISKRPYLFAIIFAFKHKALIQIVAVDFHFGIVEAYVTVIQFPKCDLPHA